MRKRLTLCPIGITPGDITARCGGVGWRRIIRFLLADFRHNCESSRTDITTWVWNLESHARTLCYRSSRVARHVGGWRVRLMKESFSRQLNKKEHPSFHKSNETTFVLLPRVYCVAKSPRKRAKKVSFYGGERLRIKSARFTRKLPFRLNSPPLENNVNFAM